MAKVIIDNIEYDVPDGKNMLEAALSLGLNLPYFCWHPAMHSVGACRQCAVTNYRDANDTRGRITMACMLDAKDGTRISINDPKSKEFRAGNIESLMINHPHDCPVCDEGGECHLQDMTVMSGHNYRRYRFKKRTHVNQYLGPFLNHEMNRCIQCYRCVRFYNDYAGGKDFNVFASAGRVYFGRSEDGVLENEFSGNLVEVCPTGVFTDKTLKKHFTRKWDLTSSPSICHGCSLGCNILASERYGSVRRVLSRYNGDVNGYFLCDRGRFGYEYTNSEQRLTRAAQKNGSAETAFKDTANFINSKPKMIGIGSPRASLESNYMLRKLVGAENFYQGIPSAEGESVNTALKMLVESGVKTPSMKEIESYDSVFVLGEDVTNTGPMVALALRQTAKTLPRQKAYAMRIQTWNDAAIREVVQDETGPFFLATPYSTKLEDIATSVFHGDTTELVNIARLVEGGIRNAGSGAGDSSNQDFASKVAKALLGSKNPLIVSGTGMLSKSVIQSAASIAVALKAAGKEVGISYIVPEANSLGVAMLGNAGFLEDAVKRSNEEPVSAVILETDLFFRMESDLAESFLNKLDKVVLLDSLENKTTPFADYILPAGTFAESSGTLVNNEGRAQRFYQVYVGKYDIKSSWAWLDMIMSQSETPRPFDEIVAEMIASNPMFEKINEVAPKADFRVGTQKIPRETHRFSGRTAMNANISVHEPKPPVDPDSPLSYTMEGYHGEQPSKDISFFWSPGWNSVQSINKYQIEVGGELHGGNPGMRLIEPSENGVSSVSIDPVSGNGAFEVLPAYHIYGSEELTSKSPAIAERTPGSYIGISSAALQKKGLNAASQISIQSGNRTWSLPVKIIESLPDNVIVVPKGFSKTVGMQFPFFTDIAQG